MIASSATAGQPAQPEPAGHARPRAPARRSASRGSCACCATTPSNGLTYSSARRISTRVVHAVAVVGEHPYARRPSRAMAPISASVSPASPCDDRARPAARRPGRPHARAARTCSTISAVSATGLVFAIACTAVKPPSAAARATRSRPSRRPRGRARAGGCAGRPGRAAAPGRRRRSTSAPGASRPAPIAAITPSVDQHVGGVAAQRRAAHGSDAHGLIARSRSLASRALAAPASR